MNKAIIPRSRSIIPVLVVAALVLTSAAWLRSAEYDEQYTLFVTAGPARPVWPAHAFAAGDVRTLQAGHSGLAVIAHELRTGDVHPPLYFWLLAAWRGAVGDGLFAARLASVLCSLATLGVVAAIGRLTGLPARLAVLLTLGCYGFTYTGTIARGFALAQLLTVLGVALLLFAVQRRRVVSALLGGTLLGAATFTNYLSVFVAASALLWLMARPVIASSTPVGSRPPLRETCRSIVPLSLREAVGGSVRATSSFRLAGTACIGFAIWLPADLWFFLAQRHSRVGQFAPFDAVSGAVLLGRYTAANLLGGLPRYLEGSLQSATAIALALVLVGLLAMTIWQWRSIATPESRAAVRHGSDRAADRPAATRLRDQQHTDRVALSRLHHTVHRIAAVRRVRHPAATHGSNGLQRAAGDPDRVTRRSDDAPRNDAASASDSRRRCIACAGRRGAAANRQRWCRRRRRLRHRGAPGTAPAGHRP